MKTTILVATLALAGAFAAARADTGAASVCGNEYEGSDMYDEAEDFGAGEEGYQGPDGYGIDPGGEDEGDTDAGDAPIDPSDRATDRTRPEGGDVGDGGDEPRVGSEREPDVPAPAEY